MTQEHKNKISISNKGKTKKVKHDKQFSRGHEPWNKGLSKKLNNALDEWYKNGGRPWNKGLVGKDNPNTGRKVSEEAKKNFSVAALKRMEGKRKGEIGTNDGNGHLKIKCNCKDCSIEMYRRTDTFKTWSGRCVNCAKLYRKNKSKYIDDFSEKRERINARRSSEYSEWRNDVLSRDNHCCVICGYKSIKSGDIIADHIKPFYLYPELRYERTNGRSLCLNCNYVYGYSHVRDKAKIINIDFKIDKKMCWKSVVAV